MTSSHDGWIDMDDLDAELERLLSGAAPSAQAPAWCGDVAVLVRVARAPARDDELAREDEIVARMCEIRLAMLAEAEAPVPAGLAEPVPTPEPIPAPEVPLVLAASMPDAKPSDTEAGAYATNGHRPPLADRLKAQSARRTIDLEEYRAKHAGERYYRAKHAAARLENSKYPLARTVGRVIAIKAVAVTTAIAVAGVAAAATTGIVATVVVPALTAPDHHDTPSVTTTVPADRKHGVRTRHATTAAGGAKAAAVSACPSLLPACLPLPPALVPTVPPEVAAAAAAVNAASAASGTVTAPADGTAPATTTTEAPPQTTTTSTTAVEPPPTTPPDPPTTDAPPTTDTVPVDPTANSLSTGGGSGG